MLLTQLVSLSTRAQTDPYKVKPQIATPNVAAFMRYGEYNANVNTGTPDIKVPLFTLQAGSLSYGMDIDYNASGIKVAQTASSVGLGWSLNYGGMISRTVKGLPDEYATSGYIDLDKSYEEKYSYNTNEQKYKYADLINDGEPDIFNFRLPTGQGGKFIYDQSRKKFINDFDPGIKIEWINKSAYSSSSFVLTLTNGNRYFFEQRQMFFDDVNIMIPAVLRNYIQTWFLSKIESIKGEVIAYQYEMTSAAATLPSGTSVQPEWLIQKSYQRKYLYSIDGRDAQLPRTVTDETISYYANVEPRIKQITTASGKVVFNYNVARYDFPGHQLNGIDVYDNQQIINKVIFSYDYFTAINAKLQYDYRLKLNSLAIGLTGEQNYNFNYDLSVALPPTNSTQQDYWGFYNGRVTDYLPKVKPIYLPDVNTNDFVGNSDRSVNPDLIQAGILKEIVYPSRGKTQFTYEPNFYLGISSELVNATFANSQVYGKGKKIPARDTIDFTVSNDVLPGTGYLNIYFSPLKPPSPYYSPADMQEVKLINLTTNTTEAIQNRVGSYLNAESYNIQLYNLKKGTRYRLITTVIDEVAVPASYATATVLGNYYSPIQKKILSDGLRIQNIKNYDHNGQLINRDEFAYGEGKVLRELPETEDNHYLQKYMIDYKCSDLLECQCFYERNYLIYTGRPNILGPDITGKNLYYQYVEKIQYNANGEPQGKVGYSRNANLSNPFQYHFPNAPYEKEFINNISFIGSSPSETYYRWEKEKSEFIKQRQILREYDIRSNKIPVIKFYRTKIYTNPTCAFARISYDSDLFGSTSFNQYFPTYKLLKEQSIDYDASGTNVMSNNTTEYTYDTEYASTIVKTSYQSNDKIKKEYFIYPYNYLPNNNFLSKLVEKNLIENPIEVVSTVENGAVKQIVEGKYSTYDNFCRLSAVSSLAGLNPAINTSDYKFSNRLKGVVPPDGTVTAFQPDDRYEKKIECLSYDSFNNLRELLENDNLRTVYLWGYNGQYPIAEIRNATYAEVATVLTQAAIDNLNSSQTEASMETLIKNASDKLRNDSRLAKAMVTTYTYKPLVGMTSKTDARGITEYYKYDGMQRLQAILDHLNNVNRSFDYHYRSN